MIENLVKLVRSFDTNANSPFIKRIDVSPATYENLKARAQSNDPSTFLGIEIDRTPVLPDTHARLHLADGRLAIWNMTENHVYLLEKTTMSFEPMQANFTKERK